jgi:hypothetical protein
MLVVRIPIPHEVAVPLLIILLVLVVIGVTVAWRTYGWDGTKGMRPEDAERVRSAFDKQFKRELPIYGGGFVLALIFFVVAWFALMK